MVGDDGNSRRFLQRRQLVGRERRGREDPDRNGDLVQGKRGEPGNLGGDFAQLVHAGLELGERMGLAGLVLHLHRDRAAEPVFRLADFLVTQARGGARRLSVGVPLLLRCGRRAAVIDLRGRREGETSIGLRRFLRRDDQPEIGRLVVEIAPGEIGALGTGGIGGGGAAVNHDRHPLESLIIRHAELRRIHLGVQSQRFGIIQGQGLGGLFGGGLSLRRHLDGEQRGA